MSETQLPVNWTVVRIKDIAKILYGKALLANSRAESGKFPVYGSGGTSSNHDAFLHEGPSIIIGRKGNVGAIYLVNKPFWCIDTAFYLDSVSEAVDIAFLMHALQVANLAQYTKSVAIPGISRDDIENVVIPLPPLPEQRRIAASLREADEIRKLQQQANEKTQEIVEAFFYDMFGNVSPEKDYPHNWKVLPLKSLTLSAQYGISDSLKDKGDIGVLRMNNITLRGWLDLSDVKFIDSTTINTQQYNLLPGDILFNRTNSKDLVGKTALWEEGIKDKFSFASYIIRVRLNTERTVPEYIWALLNSPYGKQQLFGLSKQAVNMANINTQELGSIKVVLPPFEQQIYFASYVRMLREQLKSEEAHSSKINELYQSLLAQAFTGELTASWRELHAQELARAARERDILLRGKATVTIEIKTSAALALAEEETNREDLQAQLSSFQQALYNIFVKNRENYFTVNQIYEDYGEELHASLDQVRRDLRTLAGIGLIKEVSLRVIEQPEQVAYPIVYRYLQPEDDTRNEDLELLGSRSV